MSISIYLSNIVIFCITYFLGTSILVRKNIRPVCLLCGVILLSSIQVIFNAKGPSHLSSFLMLILIFLLYFMLFEGPLISEIMLSVFSLILVSISEFISMFIFGVLCEFGKHTSVNSLLYLTSLIVSNSLFLLFVILFKKVFKKNLDIPRDLNFWLVLIVPFSTLLLFFNISDYFTLVNENEVVLVILIFLVLSNLITFYFFSRVVSALKIQEKLEREKERKKRVENEFNLLSHNYNSNFNLLHTLLHSYSDLYNLLKNKKYLELERKLNELSDKTFNEFNSIYAESLLLNSIINNEIEKLRKYSIGVRSKVNDKDIESISLPDKMEFFGYLLSSCIDVVSNLSTCNEKIIYIKSNADKEKIVIKFYFNSDQDYSEVFSNDCNIISLTQKNEFKFLSTYFEAQNEIVLLFVKFLGK